MIYYRENLKEDVPEKDEYARSSGKIFRFCLREQIRNYTCSY